MCRSSSYTQHQIAWNKWIITVTMYSIQARRSAPTYLVSYKVVDLFEYYNFDISFIFNFSVLHLFLDVGQIASLVLKCLNF